jgi:aspartate carbamoyltransferase catalytic subunit
VLQRKPRLDQLSVAIIGDVRHSRVARSAYQAFTILGVRELHIAGPAKLMPRTEEFPLAKRHRSIDAAVRGADVIMMLRIQKERMAQAEIPHGEQYFADWGLNETRLKLAKPDAIVMHPQPMNRGVEIESRVADGAQSVIRDQVRNGVAVRMAVLEAVVRGRG